MVVVKDHAMFARECFIAILLLLCIALDKTWQLFLIYPDVCRYFNDQLRRLSWRYSSTGVRMYDCFIIYVDIYIYIYICVCVCVPLQKFDTTFDLARQAAPETPKGDLIVRKKTGHGKGSDKLSEDIYQLYQYIEGDMTGSNH